MFIILLLTLDKLPPHSLSLFTRICFFFPYVFIPFAVELLLLYFCCRDCSRAGLHSAALAVVRCLCVCHVRVLCRNG